MKNLKLVLRKNIIDSDTLDSISDNCVAILETTINGGKWWIEILKPNDKGVFMVDNCYTNDFEIAYIMFLEFCLSNI